MHNCCSGAKTNTVCIMYVLCVTKFDYCLSCLYLYVELINEHTCPFSFHVCNVVFGHSGIANHVLTYSHIYVYLDCPLARKHAADNVGPCRLLVCSLSVKQFSTLFSAVNSSFLYTHRLILFIMRVLQWWWCNHMYAWIAESHMLALMVQTPAAS